MSKPIAVAMILLSPGLLFGQMETLRGRVLDPSGAVMPQVHVKLYQADNIVAEAVTSLTGEFEIAANPGEYKLEITAADFESHIEVIKIGSRQVPLQVTMKVAEVKQTIDVRDTRNEVSIDADSSLKTTVL